MTDTGIRQKTFEVRLRQRREIAIEQGGGGQENDRGDQAVLDSGQRLKRFHDTEKDDKSGRLRTDGKKRGDRSWSTLIDIGNPELEWGSGDLEAEADQNEQCTKKETRLIIQRNRRKHPLDLSEIGLPRDAINPGDTINSEARGKGAQDQVFDAGFQRSGVPAHVSHKDIKRNRDQLQGDENQNKVDRRRHPHHPGTSQYRKSEKFTKTGLRGTDHQEALDRVGVMHRHDQHNNGGQDDNFLEENSQGIGSISVHSAGSGGARLED